MNRPEDNLPDGEQLAEYLNKLVGSGRMTDRFRAKMVIGELQRDFLIGQFQRLVIEEDIEEIIPGYISDRADVLKMSFPVWKNVLIESFGQNEMKYEPEVFEEFEAISLESLLALARTDAAEWEMNMNQIQGDIRAVETFGRNVEYWKRIALILEVASKK